MLQLSDVSSIHRAVTKIAMFVDTEEVLHIGSRFMCDRRYRFKRQPLYRRFGMPPARAIIHYLTTSHVFPVYPPHPDVQRNVRVRQAGGDAERREEYS